MKKIIVTLCLLSLAQFSIAQTVTLYKVPKEEQLLHKEELETHRQKMDEKFGLKTSYKAEKELIKGDTSIITLSYTFSSLWRLKDEFEIDHSQDQLIGKEIPFQTLKRLNGGELHLDELKGKPTLMNFWFTTCGPCIKEMPALNRIKDQFGNKMNFIAVTHNGANKVNKFLSKREFNYDHIINAKEFMTKELYLYGLPEIIVLDENGKILKFIGGIHNEEMEKKLMEELEELVENPQHKI